MRLRIASALATGRVAIALYPLFEGGSLVLGVHSALLLVMTGGGRLASRRLPLAGAGWRQRRRAAGSTLTVGLRRRARRWAGFVPDQGVGRRAGAAAGRPASTTSSDIAAPVPAPGIVLLTSRRRRPDRDPGGPVRRPGCAGRRSPGCRCWRCSPCRPTVLPEPISWPAFIIAACGYWRCWSPTGASGSATGAACWSPTAHVLPVPAPPHPDSRRLAPVGQAHRTAPRSRWPSCCPRCCPRWSRTRSFGFGVGGNGTAGGGIDQHPEPHSQPRGQLKLPSNAPS